MYRLSLIHISTRIAPATQQATENDSHMAAHHTAAREVITEVRRKEPGHIRAVSYTHLSREFVVGSMETYPAARSICSSSDTLASWSSAIRILAFRMSYELIKAFAPPHKRRTLPRIPAPHPGFP